MLSYLNTEICTSKQKRFPLVTFVDTPGLVDGGMNYPFDVNEGILWLGELVDLIFVFFDPIGQVCNFDSVFSSCSFDKYIIRMYDRHFYRPCFPLFSYDDNRHSVKGPLMLLKLLVTPVMAGECASTYLKPMRQVMSLTGNVLQSF